MVSARLGNHLETKKTEDQDTGINSKWIQNLDVGIKTVRESEENMWESPRNYSMARISQQ